MEKIRIKTIDEKFYRAIGNQLRHYRTKLNMSQRELAKKTGYSRAMIDHWELGANKIKPKQLEVLCNALCITNILTVDVKLGLDYEE